MGPGEVLLAQNDVINAIYYIANGSMEVLQGESVAAILGKSIVIVLQCSVCLVVLRVKKYNSCEAQRSVVGCSL